MQGSVDPQRQGKSKEDHKRQVKEWQEACIKNGKGRNLFKSQPDNCESFDEGVGAPLLILDAKSKQDKRSGGSVFLLFASRAEIWKMLPRIDKPTKGKIFEAPPGSELCAACAIDLKVEQQGAGDESADERRHWLVASVDMTLPAPIPTADPTLTLARP